MRVLLAIMAIWLCLPAFAQNGVPLDRVVERGMRLGDVTVGRAGPYDEIVSLDPNIVAVEAVGAEGIQLRAVGVGTGTILILRGGMTDTIVIEVNQHKVSREGFGGGAFVPEDSVPSWFASSEVRVAGSERVDSRVQSSFGGGVAFKSEEDDIDHRSEIHVGSGSNGVGISSLLSTTHTSKFDFAIGETPLTTGLAAGSFGLRGIDATLRPAGREGPGSVGLILGQSRQVVCCGLFNPDGEVLAAARGGLEFEHSVTKVVAGGFVSRLDPTPRPVLMLEQELRLENLRGRLIALRLGDGFAGALTMRQASKKFDTTFVGNFRQKGTFLPTRGPTDSTTGTSFVRVTRTISPHLRAGVEGGMRVVTAGPRNGWSSNVAGLLSGGRGTKYTGSYEFRYAREEASPDPTIAHQLQSNVVSRTARRFDLRAGALVVLNGQFGHERTSVNFSTLSEVGPVIKIGPDFWGLVTKSASSFGLGGRMTLERARVRSNTRLGVQSQSIDGALTLRPQLDSQIEWAATRTLSVYGGGNIATSLSTPELRYSTFAGIRLAGSVNDILASSHVDGRVFVDTDGDGVFGGADYGVQGVEVGILDKSVVSGEGGAYRIRGLLPGQYTVHVKSSSFLLRDGRVPPVSVSRFGSATLDVPLTDRKRLDVRVFHDVNGNAKLDANEPGVPADLITISGPDGVSTHTARTGNITVYDVSVGTHDVVLSAPMIGDGFLPSGALVKRVQVDERGFQRVLFPVVAQRQLAGRVCRDINDNGRSDSVDSCEEGVLVRLNDGRTMRTRQEGRFAFDAIAVGEAYVEVEGMKSEVRTFHRQPQSLRDEVILLPFKAPPAPVPRAGSGGSLRLKAMRVQIGETMLKVGEREIVRVDGTYSDLSQQPLEGAAIVSTRPEVARIVDGVLIATEEGTTKIRAVVGALKSPEIEVTVRRLPVVGLVARPGRLELPFGEVETISAKAIFVDGDSELVTDRVAWACDDPLVCKVEGNGVFVAVGPGTTVLRGEYLNVSSQAIEVRVTTGDAVPTSMKIAPGRLTLGLESTGRVYVDAALSNGRDVHLTTEVEWKTENPEVIEILPGGRVRPITVGEARIRATFKGIESEAAIIQVVPAVGLVVVPNVGVVPVGATVPIRVLEVLGDGSTKQLSRIRWSSSIPDVATVESGLIKAHLPGTTELVAQYRGLTSLPVSIEVIPAVLTALRASQESVVLAGEDIGYVDAVATFDDGRETVATSVVHWTSSNPSVAKIGEDGVVEAVAPGRAVVSGSWLGQWTGPVEVLVDPTISEVPAAILVEPGAVSISAQGRQALALSVVSETGRLLPERGVKWEVGDPSIAWVERGEVRAVSVGSTEIVAVRGEVRSEPVSVEVRAVVGVVADPPLGRLPVGAVVQLTALAVVDDGRTEDLTRTGSVNWSSDNPDVVRISDDGKLLAFKAGRANVSATWRNMKTLPMSLAVVDLDITSLEVTPEQASLRVDETHPLSVVATFSDGQTADATPHVSWTSTRPTVARAGSAMLEGREPGVAEVFSTWMGVQSASVRVTVAPASAVGVVLANASEVMLVGRRIPLRAVAITDDGKLLDASDQTTWEVVDDQVLGVDTNGFVEAKAPGITTLTGVVGGQASPSLQVEVVSLAVIRLDLSPGALSVRPDDEVPFKVQATLTDGRSVDVTPQVSWEIDGQGVAIDRYNRLQVGHGAKASVRARIEDVRSGWAEIVATE